MKIQQYEVSLAELATGVYEFPIKMSESDIARHILFKDHKFIISVEETNELEPKSYMQNFMILQAGVMVKTPSAIRYVGTAVKSPEGINEMSFNEPTLYHLYEI